jgi:TetR/AcrR family transcriptional regulator, regulator of cefoperazone and chloramphenicol sensitivity
VVVVTGDASSDSNTKALIRQAALLTFAERGFAGASIRVIATAAGVSPGLVQYHFQTKEGLRTAVDAFVLERTAELISSVQPLVLEEPSDFADGIRAALTALAHADPALVPYLRRTLLEGGPSAEVMFDGLMAIARGVIDQLLAAGRFQTELDPVWGTIQTLMLNLGPLLLQPLVERHLEQPLLSDAGIRRWQDANAVIGLHGILVRPEPMI